MLHKYLQNSDNLICATIALLEVFRTFTSIMEVERNKSMKKSNFDSIVSRLSNQQYTKMAKKKTDRKMKRKMFDKNSNALH